MTEDPLSAILDRLDALDARLDAAERPVLTLREAAHRLGLGRDGILSLARKHGALVNVGGERGARVLWTVLIDGLAAEAAPKARRARMAAANGGQRRTGNAEHGTFGDPDSFVRWNTELG